MGWIGDRCLVNLLRGDRWLWEWIGDRWLIDFFDRRSVFDFCKVAIAVCEDG
ncbi:MAG: hypothetical protein IM537_16185 [Pseudanabaena sp. M57BS1SP1A06MG]|nr:hypothetical protein [Pseudanabaena sp. M53BS1SP1A06MG]MCA6581923.1 hypothetical protein [Pseudanabaena sp. M34BS1SP1A06MG]MCA6593282.1 hypothetical protein [Pseudanabaena sp. M38BS1SP1A06MG]MCA6601695.1 hypothetical protein [Pseudanabaena sp. M57BS1SP1A06MG]